MNFIVTGLPGSGKSTFIALLKEIGQIPAADILETGDINSLVHHLNDKTQIIVIQTPLILCHMRMQRNISFTSFRERREIESQEMMIKYVTELPGCTIIKNELSPEHLKLQIKKLLKK